MSKDTKGLIITVFIIIMSIVTIFISCFWASSIYYEKKEDMALFANAELDQLQKKVSRLDIRLTRNELKTQAIENKEILLLQKDVLKKFLKDIEAFESAMKDYRAEDTAKK